MFGEGGSQLERLNNTSVINSSGGISSRVVFVMWTGIESGWT